MRKARRRRVPHTAPASGAGHARPSQKGATKSPSVAPPTPASTERASKVTPDAASVHESRTPCACGGGCPRCAGGLRSNEEPSRPATPSNPKPLSPDHALERDANQAVQRAQSMSATSTQHPRSLVMPHTAPRPQNLQGGQSLPSATRSQFEPRFGVDLRHVRVHTDRAAAQRAREQRAEAYTQGADIVFGEDRYAPGTAPHVRVLVVRIGR